MSGTGIRSRNTLPRVGEPLVAYRSALAKVEPGEAFLARTRLALAAAGEDPQQSWGRTLGEAGEGVSPRRAGNTDDGTAAAGRPQPGMSREARRRWARGPARRLLPAACLALMLAALPVTALMGWRAGGANLSSGAAAQDTAESVTADTAAESSPAAAAAPAAGEPMENSMARDRPDAGEEGAEFDSAEEQKTGGDTGHASPAGGADGAAQSEIALESSPALMETGEPPAAALAALRSGNGWRDGAPGGYDPDAVEVLGWSGSEIVFAGPDPEPAVCFWVREPDGGTCLVFVPQDG